MTAPLTEPTSDTMAPCFSAGAMARAIASLAPTGAQRMTQSAVATARARSSVTRSPSPKAFARSKTEMDESARTIRRAARRWRAARAIDEPISPTPIIASSSKIGSARGAPSRSITFASHELAERCDHASIGLLAADRHAQGVRQSIGGDGAKNESPRAQEHISVCGRSARFVREGQQQKVSDAWRDSDPKLSDRLSEPREPNGIVRDCAIDMRRVFDAGDACRLGGPIQIERSADTVQCIDDVRRSIAPTNAQGGQSMDLREGPGHDNVVRHRSKLEARRIVVAGHIFGVSGVNHQERVRRKALVQTPHFGERNVGPG